MGVMQNEDIEKAIRELAGMYSVWFDHDPPNVRIEAQNRNKAIDLAIYAIKNVKFQDEDAVGPKAIELEQETRDWLDAMSPAEALGNIADICIDWDGYRTRDGLGSLINEIWAYARYCAKKFAE